MRYSDAMNPAEYLREVLKSWKEYRKHNGGICKVIEKVLEENDQLKKRLAQYEKNEQNH